MRTNALGDLGQGLESVHLHGGVNGLAVGNKPFSGDEELVIRLAVGFSFELSPFLHFAGWKPKFPSNSATWKLRESWRSANWIQQNGMITVLACVW